ncbi:MAG: hypothetical protein EBR83_03365 [Verrucomicrobia bacterium]|nr:hypothetical protein [Verrucomicrobiota bacterium]
MQTLGERLQEARQRLGVTLREAAEFTKIRTDYLQSMEANQFESIPLVVIGIAVLAIIIALFFS